MQAQPDKPSSKMNIALPLVATVATVSMTMQETGMRNDVYVQARAQVQELLGAIVLQLGEETT